MAACGVRLNEKFTANSSVEGMSMKFEAEKRSANSRMQQKPRISRDEVSSRVGSVSNKCMITIRINVSYLRPKDATHITY